jgi:predicted NBD/HSP70 family sugar kinase
MMLTSETVLTSSYSGGSARSLLRLVRARQPISRAELARQLGVERSTVTDIVKPLLNSRVLRETEPFGTPKARSSGRPGVGLVLNTRDKFFIGVNVGVRRSQVGAVTADGRVIAEEVFDTPGDADDALRLVRSSVLGLRARAGGGGLIAVGVSVPGPTCAERRRLMYAPHLGWRDVAIADALQELRVEGEIDLRDVPVVVENDATAAAMFEACTRLSKETREEWRDFALVRAGTGIGVGVVMGGEVYRGAGANGGWAGEFGHMTIVADGKPCPCGNRGCWERYASASSAASLYAGDRCAARSSAPRFVEIVARARSGERRAQATLEQVGHYLGIGVANVMSGLGVSRVVVSGRVVHGWKFMRDTLQSAVGRSMAGRLAQWSVVAGKATGAGLGGAIEVAVDQYWRRLSG